MTLLTSPPVSVTQAAQRLGVHRRTVLRMIRAGRLEAVKLGQNTAGWAISPEALDRVEQEVGK